MEFQSGNVEAAQRMSRQALASDTSNSSALELFRAVKPVRAILSRYIVDIHGETDDGERFLKSMECLAASEEEAATEVAGIQEIFQSEVWWEVESLRFVELVRDEHPGVCQISQYDFAEEE